MKKLLYIQGSPRGERSRSSSVAEAFLEALSARTNDWAVETLNVWDTELPAFDGRIVEGRYKLLAGQQVDPDQESGWAEVRRVAEHFLSFDGYLWAVPMWNFGLPYRLKHYIDVLTHPGLAFNFLPDGHLDGLYAGRKALVISSSALPFADSSSQPSPDDHQEAYMRSWMGFCGLTDVQWVRAAPMFGPEEIVGPALEAARKTARQIALSF